MSDQKSRKPEPEAQARQRRMADALRANLRRRKDQSREQAQERTAPAVPDTERKS